MKYFFTFILIALFTMCDFVYAKYPNITEKAGIVMDADSMSVLYNIDMNKKIYPASTTKVLTAIIAIENLDLNTEFTVSKSAIESLPADSSSMRLKEGQVFTIKDYLYGLLLVSRK